VIRLVLSLDNSLDLHFERAAFVLRTRNLGSPPGNKEAVSVQQSAFTYFDSRAAHLKLKDSARAKLTADC
jgi:hypothetical protein